MDRGFLNASSRQLPSSVSTRTPPRARIGGHDTPPIAASGTNRVPVIERRRLSSAQGHHHPRFSTPFPVPRYLQHSTFAPQFFTTPSAASLFTHLASDLIDPSGSNPNSGGGTYGDDNLSEGLGGGDLHAGRAGSRGTILLPTCWDEDDRCSLIELSSDGLGVSFGGSGKYGDRDAAAVRSNRPIPPQAPVYYFEVTIENKGHSGYIGIGFSHRTVSLSRLPGWEAFSWGYHGDDGRAFCCLGTGENFGPTFTTGDVIGCGVDYSGASPEDTWRHAAADTHKDGGRAFFTKNGDFLGYAFSNLHGKLYPSVGLRTSGEVVRANFGSEPFVFDIDSLERKRAVLAQVDSTPIPASLLLPPPPPSIPSILPIAQSEKINDTLQSLITSYLVHHGYTSTADAFANQVTLERRERSKGLLPPGSSFSLSGEDESDMSNLDAVASTSAGGSDSSVRGEIRKACLAGDPDRARELTELKYPTVFENDDEDVSGGLRFKLRTRAFVEAVIRALPASSPAAAAIPSARAKGKGKAAVQEDVHMDDIEDEHYTTPPASPLFEPVADARELDDVSLRLGKALYSDYSDDKRPEVKATMDQIFSLIAYSRLEDFTGRLAWLTSMEAREALADELNSAILAPASTMAAKNSYAVQQLCQKMKNLDSDLRFMALTDLISDIQRSGDQFGVDEATEHSTVEQVLALMNDTNGEVKNLAVKTLAALIKHVSEARIQVIIDRLVSFTASKDEGVRDIASLGLKTVVSEITPGTPLAVTACGKLAPKVIAQVESSSSSPELLIDALELLSDIVSRFESTVRTMTALQNSILKAVTPLLSSDRAVIRKRSVTTLAILSACSDAALFNSLITGTVVKALKGTNNEKTKTAVSLVGALAKAAPTKMGKKAAELVPLVLKAAAKDDDETREGALQTLEALVLKCPTEVAPTMLEIIELATTLVKYDPNYAGDEDEDVTMEDGDAGDDEDEDDDFGDEYSDDDDTSWKVRRGATKLLSACILTRSDLLSTFYRTVSPALIARFGEREETVKVEIWATYTTLLAQTKVWGSSPQASSGSDAGNGRLKRKRSSDVMETDEGPVGMLLAQTPAIAKSIIKQLSAKSLGTRQAGFTLLHELIAVLDGGLETQISALVPRIEAALHASDVGLTGAATTLKIEVLSFVGLLVRTHHAKTLTDELPKIVPLLVGAVGDKFNKIAAGAFVACADLVRVLRPVSPAPAQISPAIVPHLKAIYDATMKRLGSTDADEEVKGKGIICLGVLFFHAGDELASESDKALSFLRDRLKNEVSRLIAVRVVAEVAASPVCRGARFDAWVQECLVEVSTLLRKVNRPLKVAAFSCISALLRTSGQSLPPATSKALLGDLQPLVNDADINLLPPALDAIATVLVNDPKSIAQVQQSILPRVFELVQSPLLQGASLDALLAFFTALIRAGAPPLPLVEVLAQSANSVKKTVEASGTQSGMQSLATSSRCIGVIVRDAPHIAEGVVKEYSSSIKGSKTPAASLILGLLTLGEIGRTVDLSGDEKTFAKVIEHFSAASEDVRRSAAFAAGNITVGNPSVFLPSILSLIQSDDKKRYLALQALKEVIIHSPPTELAQISDTLWTPLFENCQAQEEGTRNVAADCLGQLTVTNPAKYLPQLQARLHSDSRHTRATVIAAIRFTFTNESSSYDELLAPLITEFFKLIHDTDLGVRRLALSSLNSAAHNKPHLLREQLSTLLPELYSQTVVDESLIRIVEMGPFKHKVDDGLDIRKTAYECMHTLLDTCLKEIEIHEYLRRVLAGLSDEEDVKKLCYLMLVKLAQIAPTAVTQRLDDSVPAFTEVLQTTLKDTAVKQETERLAELQKAALRCMVVLNRLSSPANTPKFSQAITTVVLAGKLSAEFKELSAATTSLTRMTDAMETD
ncbi:hypothetical protein RQP46_000372 [Phenoliferia psychrophenolica]